MGTDYNSNSGYSQVVIADPSHPMAAGLTGTVTVTTSSSVQFGWGKPAASAIKVASLPSDPSKYTLFGYESGAALVGGMSAPARRVGIFLWRDTPTVLNADGWSLFDAAARWIAPLQVVATQPFTSPHSLSLNGTDAYVSVPNSSSLNITGPITIEAWVKRNPGGSQSIVERYGPSSGGYAVRIESDRLSFYTLNSSSNFDRLVSNSVVSTGAWHHVAAVFDGSQKQIFIDGLLDASAATTFGPGSGTTNLRIGVAGDSNANFFGGLIDEVRVTTGVRYASSFIPDLAHAADGSDARGLWNFDTQTAGDASGKDNHGTFGGGVYCSSTCPSVDKKTEWLTAITQAEAADQPVRIDFDQFAHNTAITTQYPQAAFSSSPGLLPAIYNPLQNSDTITVPISRPNTLTRINQFYPFFYDHFAPLTVQFARPVNNLRFGVTAIDAIFGRVIFEVEIYQNSVLKDTWTMRSLGNGVNMMVNVGQPAYQFGYNEVTKIVIKNVRDPAGLAFDEFTFNTPPLKVDIKNPRVSGSLNGTIQKAMVGAYIPLTAAPSAGGGSYSWTFTGNYSVSGGGASSSAVTIRPTEPGPITAKVTYAQGGNVVTGTVNISAIMPELDDFHAEQSVNVLTKGLAPNVPCLFALPGESIWMLGCPPTHGFGISFTALATIPSGAYLTDLSQSGVKYVQTVSAMRKTRLSSGTISCFTRRTGSEDNVNSGWALDDNPAAGAGDPMSNDPMALRTFSTGNALAIVASDTPGTAWRWNAYDVLKLDDRFQTFVVYYVGNPKTPVYQKRIGSLHWEWRGMTVYDAIDFPDRQKTDPTAIPYKFLENLNTEETQILSDDVVSTTVYNGLNSSIGDFKQCPGGPPAVQNRIDSSRFFVNQHYLDFLNRPADERGSDFWTSNITKCAFDDACIDRKRVDVARAYFFSEEFIKQVPGLAPSLRGTDSYNREMVRQCYYRYLRRPCDPESCDAVGFNFWVNKLNSQFPTMGDGAYNEMLRAFILSTEYRQRFVLP